MKPEKKVADIVEEEKIEKKIPEELIEKQNEVTTDLLEGLQVSTKVRKTFGRYKKEQVGFGDWQ